VYVPGEEMVITVVVVVPVKVAPPGFSVTVQVPVGKLVN
jgi:hypothetical protein